MSGPRELPLTRADLNQAECADPACDHLHDDSIFLVAVCHPHRGFTLQYDKVTGCMRVECWECGKLVFEIVIASSLSG